MREIEFFAPLHRALSSACFASTLESEDPVGPISETSLVHEYFKRHSAGGLAVLHAIAAVCADCGRAFFLRTAAEIKVISKPIGNGSINVISTL
jgi:hypothetical protein